MPENEFNFAARVVLSGLPKPLTYRLGLQQNAADVGDQVIVEVGAHERQGWLIEKLPLEQALKELSEQEHLERSKRLEDSADHHASISQLAFFSEDAENTNVRRLKEIRNAKPAFLPDQLELFQWMAEYYGVTLADVIDNAIPRIARSKEVRCIIPGETLRDSSEETLQLIENLERRAPVQAQIIKLLRESSGPLPISRLRTAAPAPTSAIKALEKKGLIAVINRKASELCDSSEKSHCSEEPQFNYLRPEKLTQSQANAVRTIAHTLPTNTFAPFLLFGVTGSGKTEVYLRAIEEVLDQGGSALIIVPEIALTPQFVDQFYTRLNVPLALLHSQVGASARWTAWESLLRGDVRVALGARSAVFAPLQNLSLVIVDEEHETSYKQSDGLRYNARDVAVMRAKFAGATVVLGSATPSFESLVNVQRHRYELLELPERATTRPVPQIEVFDLNSVKRKEMPSENISPALFDGLKDTLDSGGQAVILYNRRGFASYLQCEKCDEVASCPNCSVPLTYHRSRTRLLCHYCNLKMEPPTHCLFCRDPKTSRVELDEQGKPLGKKTQIESFGRLIHRGGGTEKVVDELSELFPKATIVRMDRDTVGKKSAYREILGSMRGGKADILVGTQMIAKGHDLPGVTLVGIISADVGLHLPDFRSSEKAYQLITQAAGRSGRGDQAGRVIVQTREAKHPTIVATVTGRFRAFARYELEYRKSLGYPPLGRLLRLIISSTDRGDAFEGALLVRKTLGQITQHYQSISANEKNRGLSILGPAPAPHEKLCRRYRWHILIKTHSAKLVSETARTLNIWKSGVKHLKDFRLAVDVDPMDML